MKTKYILTSLIALTSTPLAAQNLPATDYFIGAYELVGRTPGPDGVAFMDWVQVSAESDARNAKMTLHSCRSGDGELGPGNPREGVASLTGHLGDWQLFCIYANDSDNYPHLTCYAVVDGNEKIPGVITLWPAHWDKPNHAADCK